MSETRVLITGTTGYIGGSVLTELLSNKNGPAGRYSISALVRGEDQVEILKSKGVNAILFKGLDDIETITRVASENDIVINTANTFHSPSANALILGLAERGKKTGTQTHLIHTSGTSNFSDHPITNPKIKHPILSDKEDIYTYEKEIEATDPYPQRATDILVTDTGLSHGVKTYIITAPTIYGAGTGIFNQSSIQIPILTRAAKEAGKVEILGDGEGVWDHVHIDDLVDLYTLILGKVASGENIPDGKKGIYFSGTGEHTWRQISEGIAKAGVELGVLEDGSVSEIGIVEAGEKWTGGNGGFAEMALGSSARTRAVLGKELGWKPTRTDKDFEAEFLRAWKVVLEQKD